MQAITQRIYVLNLWVLLCDEESDNLRIHHFQRELLNLEV